MEPSTTPGKIVDIVETEPKRHGYGTKFANALLLGMGSRVNNRGVAQHVYGGTVPEKTIQRRRAANKAARASRRANRRG